MAPCRQRVIVIVPLDNAHCGGVKERVGTGTVLIVERVRCQDCR